MTKGFVSDIPRKDKFSKFGSSKDKDLRTVPSASLCLLLLLHLFALATSLLSVRSGQQVATILSYRHASRSTLFYDNAFFSSSKYLY